MSQPIDILKAYFEGFDESLITSRDVREMEDFADRMNPNLPDEELMWIFEKAGEVFLNL